MKWRVDMTMKEWLNLGPYQQKWGKHYGYRQCCIDAFINRDPNIIVDPARRRNDIEPLLCPDCAKKVETGKMNKEEYYKNSEHTRLV